jgi:hypothetical protein
VSSPAELRARSRSFRGQGLCASCGAEAEEGRTLCAEHLRYHRQFKREVRARNRAAGLCFCGQPAIEGRSTCSVCTERRRQWEERQRKVRAANARQRENRKLRARKFHANGRCASCGISLPAGDGRWRCRDCHAVKVDSDAERRAERRARGRCRCGRRARAGLATCSRCGEVQRRATVRSRARRQALGICYACTSPALTGSRCCQFHLEQHRKGYHRRKRRARLLVPATKRAA